MTQSEGLLPAPSLSLPRWHHPGNPLLQQLLSQQLHDQDEQHLTAARDALAMKQRLAHFHSLPSDCVPLHAGACCWPERDEYQTATALHFVTCVAMKKGNPSAKITLARSCSCSIVHAPHGQPEEQRHLLLHHRCTNWMHRLEGPPVQGPIEAQGGRHDCLEHAHALHTIWNDDTGL